ncbi:hypothetical protein F511_22639 [Dorcoceras hygrometricum]|uniref:Uncharacterized protein n=1 Tax=Dorcoceras hygrometricum TaxID=472368 RepID=A0A2Z7D7Z0_9LAMI|nr:hypothetical protein F511_22639 [Dorcoceras hygrometricum]
MPIDDLLIQICDDLLLPVTAAEVTMLRLGAFSSSGDKGKAKLGEDDQVTDNATRKLFALICRDVEVLVQVNMPIDDLLIQICDDLLLPVTAAEVTMLRLGAFSSSGDKGKAKLGEDDQVTDNAARKLFALICRDVEVLVQVRTGDAVRITEPTQADIDNANRAILERIRNEDSLRAERERDRDRRERRLSRSGAYKRRRVIGGYIEIQQMATEESAESYSSVQQIEYQQMRRGAKYEMSCDDISFDVITISRWISADEAKREKLKRRRVENQQMD